MNLKISSLDMREIRISEKKDNFSAKRKSSEPLKCQIVMTLSTILKLHLNTWKIRERKI